MADREMKQKAIKQTGWMRRGVVGGGGGGGRGRLNGEGVTGQCPNQVKKMADLSQARGQIYDFGP